MDKDDAVHTHTHTHSGLLLSHKNETMPFRATWLQLEIIILSKGSQKEKNKYHTLTHVLIHMESRKIVLMKLFTGKKCRCRPRHRLVDTLGVRRGWDELRKLH